MILITLGVLIILGKMNAWSFGQSWPLLLIVIAAGTLIQRTNDLAGWIIGCVGGTPKGPPRPSPSQF